MKKKRVFRTIWPISDIRFLGAHFIRVLIGLLILMVLLTILELFALATVPAFFAAVWTPDDYFKQVILRFSILTMYFLRIFFSETKSLNCLLDCILYL